MGRSISLERPGGDSQNVYLTSSIVDLSKFVNSKVKIWDRLKSSNSWLAYGCRKNSSALALRYDSTN